MDKYGIFIVINSFHTIIYFTYYVCYCLSCSTRLGGDIMVKRFEILELVDEDDGGISYLVSDGKILIEVHDKKECAIKLKEILDNEW